MLILGGMIGYRQYWVATGERAFLRVSPVDPRDLFRGDYVSLSYEISTLDLEGLGAKESFQPKEKVYVNLQAQADGTWKAAGVSKSPPGGKNFIQGVARFERRDSKWEVIVKDDLGNLHTLSPRWRPAFQIGDRVTFCLDEGGQVVNLFKEDPSRKSTCRGGPPVTGILVDRKETPFRLLHVEYGIESFFVQEGKGRDIESGRAGRDLKVEVALRRDGKAMLTALWIDGKVFH